MIKRLFIGFNKLLIISTFVILSACASVNTTDITVLNPSIQDISSGLPNSGLWRQNIVLFDIDKNGYDEIITPPPRKASDEKRRPHIFKWNQFKNTWDEAKYSFQITDDFNYGGIAIGDIDNNGLFDIILGNHEKKVTLLKNNGDNSFLTSYPFNIDLISRAVVLQDINNDGLLDISCLSEYTMPDKADAKKGVFVGINEGGTFKIRQLEESDGIFGDSITVGDVNGDGKKDIIIAPYINVKAYKKFIWLGDGKSGFKYYPINFIADNEITMSVKTADIDGDGVDEIIYLISSVGENRRLSVKVFKLINNEMKELSKGLEDIKSPYVFDVMIDDDKKALLGTLGEDGFSLYKYENTKWTKINEIKMTRDDTIGVYDIKMSRQKADGSLLIVYILGNEQFEKKGIKAFKIKK